MPSGWTLHVKAAPPSNYPTEPHIDLYLNSTLMAQNDHYFGNIAEVWFHNNGPDAIYYARITELRGRAGCRAPEYTLSVELIQGPPAPPGAFPQPQTNPQNPAAGSPVSAPLAPRTPTPQTARNVNRATATWLPTQIAKPVSTVTQIARNARVGESRWTVGASGGTILDATGVWLTIPANTLAEDAVVFIRALGVEIAAQADGVRVLRVIEINIRDARGNAVTTPAQPMRVCLRYNDEQLKQAGGATSLLILQNPGQANEKELALARTASPETPMVCAETTELGTFALATREPKPQAQADQRVEIIRMGVTVASLALFVGALSLGGLAAALWLRRQRS